MQPSHLLSFPVFDEYEKSGCWIREIMNLEKYKEGLLDGEITD